MKTILTTIFAIAVMVFAFNAAPAHANDDIKCDFADCSDPDNHKFPKIVKIKDLDQEDRDVVVAYIGARFCLVHPEAEICNNDWWNSEENEGEVASLSDAELDEKLASVIDYCERVGNCLMLEEGRESETAMTRPFLDYERRLCDKYPEFSFYCGQNWWNEEGADSKDGSGGRNVADSGDEGSTSAAGANEQ